MRRTQTSLIHVFPATVEWGGGAKKYMQFWVWRSTERELTN